MKTRPWPAFGRQGLDADTRNDSPRAWGARLGGGIEWGAPTDLLVQKTCLTWVPKQPFSWSKNRVSRGSPKDLTFDPKKRVSRRSPIDLLYV